MAALEGAVGGECGEGEDGDGACVDGGEERESRVRCRSPGAFVEVGLEGRERVEGEARRVVRGRHRGRGALLFLS